MIMGFKTMKRFLNHTGFSKGTELEKKIQSFSGLSEERVKEKAKSSGNGVLLSFIMMYENGSITWEEAMQMAALTLDYLMNTKIEEVVNFSQKMADGDRKLQNIMDDILLWQKIEKMK